MLLSPLNLLLGLIFPLGRDKVVVVVESERSVGRYFSWCFWLETRISLFNPWVSQVEIWKLVTPDEVVVVLAARQFRKAVEQRVVIWTLIVSLTSRRGYLARSSSRFYFNTAYWLFFVKRSCQLGILFLPGQIRVRAKINNLIQCKVGEKIIN